MVRGIVTFRANRIFVSRAGSQRHVTRMIADTCIKDASVTNPCRTLVVRMILKCHRNTFHRVIIVRARNEHYRQSGRRDA